MGERERESNFFAALKTVEKLIEADANRGVLERERESATGIYYFRVGNIGGGLYCSLCIVHTHTHRVECQNRLFNNSMYMRIMSIENYGVRGGGREAIIIRAVTCTSFNNFMPITSG